MWMWLALTALAIALFYWRIHRRSAARRRAEMRHFDRVIDTVREAQRQEREQWRGR
jgi:Flp pilus assembly protein TadB